MIDLRLWRIALLAIPAALIVGMFSLRDVPPPLTPTVPPDAFDGAAAHQLAEELAGSAPDPRPGSEADQALGELVFARFAAIEGAEVSEQRFEASFEGKEVELRNLILVLPGQSERQVALIAQRDVAAGSGAASSIAATATLLEIASGFGGTTHRKTLIFVSTDGGSIGALGARRFIDHYTDAGLLDAAVVLSQPASPDPSTPLVVPWSTGPESTSASLALTATETVSEESGEPAGDERPLDDLFRLALPAALGEQGPLVESGLDAVRLSSSGELPPRPGTDEPDEVSSDTIDGFGRATLSLLLALDAAPSPIEHGPSAYIGLAGNLLPGWTIGILALAMLLPVGVGAFSGLFVSARSPEEAARGMAWAATRAIPFLGAVVVTYALALVGVIPSPEFPFDPRREELGVGGTIGVLAVVAAYAALAFLLRPLSPPPAAARAAAAPAALGLAALAGFGIWLVNPYLALLVAVGLHLWLLGASQLVNRRAGVAALVAGGLVPLAALLVDLAGRFDAGPGVIWDVLFMFTGGEIADVLVLLGCVLAGSGVAIVALASPGPAPLSPRLRIRPGSDADERGGRRLAVGREAPAATEQPREEPPEGEEAMPGEGVPESRPAPDADQPAPARDPRLWSKPRGSSSAPSGVRRTTPSPALSEPISVRP